MKTYDATRDPDVLAYFKKIELQRLSFIYAKIFYQIKQALNALENKVGKDDVQKTVL